MYSRQNGKAGAADLFMHWLRFEPRPKHRRSTSASLPEWTAQLISSYNSPSSPAVDPVDKSAS